MLPDPACCLRLCRSPFTPHKVHTPYSTQAKQCQRRPEHLTGCSRHWSASLLPSRFCLLFMFSVPSRPTLPAQPAAGPRAGMDACTCRWFWGLRRRHFQIYVRDGFWSAGATRSAIASACTLHAPHPPPTAFHLRMCRCSLDLEERPQRRHARSVARGALSSACLARLPLVQPRPGPRPTASCGGAGRP